MKQLFGVLRHRNFALLAGSNLVNQLGQWGRMIGIGWAARGLTDTALLITLSHGSQFVPTLVFAPVSGLIADRFDRRTVAIVGTLGMAVPSAVIAMMVRGGHLTIPWLMVLAFLGGTFQTVTLPAMTALVPATVPSEEVQAAISLTNVFANASRFVGATIVGLIIGWFGTAAAFWYNSISLVLVVVPLAMIRLIAPARSRATEPLRTQLAGGFRIARQTPAIGNLLVLNGVIGLLIVHQPLQTLVVTDLLGADADALGYLSSALGGGAILGALFAGRAVTDRDRRISVIVGTTSVAAGMLVLSSATTVPVGLLAQAMFGFGLITVVTTSVAIVTLASPEAYLGRVAALQGTTIAGMVPVCAVVGGLAADAFGTRDTILVAAVVLALYVAYFLIRRLATMDIERLLAGRRSDVAASARASAL